MKKLLELVLLLHVVETPAHARSWVVPASLDNAYGNGAVLYPFDVAPGNSARYQQVFGASEFSAGASDGLLISHLAFRVDQFEGGPFRSTIPDIQIDLSTTSRAPDSLSPVFAVNVGPDNTTVFSGSMSIRSSGVAGPGSWDILIPLNSPFPYYPSSGNLLLDVRNYSGAFTSLFDGVVDVGDSVSSVYAATGDGTGSVLSSSGITMSLGLVADFEYSPIPEPSSLLIFCFGLAISTGWWRKTRQTSSKN